MKIRVSLKGDFVNDFAILSFHEGADSNHDALELLLFLLLLLDELLLELLAAFLIRGHPLVGRLVLREASLATAACELPLR